MLTRGFTNKLPVMLNMRDIPKGVHTGEKKRRTVSTIKVSIQPPQLHILTQELIQAETRGTSGDLRHYQIHGLKYKQTHEPYGTRCHYGHFV